jgi:hypothetical protein
MILNAYAILDAFINLFRLGFGLLILLIGLSAWRVWNSHQTLSEKHQAIDVPSLLNAVGRLARPGKEVSCFFASFVAVSGMKDIQRRLLRGQHACVA